MSRFNRAFMKKYLPPEVIPLIIPITFAAGFGIYIGTRTLSGAPDVHVFGKTPRYEAKTVREDPHFAHLHPKAADFDRIKD
jgi:hypothetical protein